LLEDLLSYPLENKQIKLPRVPVCLDIEKISYNINRDRQYITLTSYGLSTRKKLDSFLEYMKAYPKYTVIPLNH